MAFKQRSVVLTQSGVPAMALIETTVEGLGYAFVEAAWAGSGLLRVTIDRNDGEAVTVDDCEKVTRQLQYTLEVDGVDYQRLEVSSPGLDRLLRRHGDFERFAGLAVDLTLRQPFQGRKKYRGLLQQPQQPGEGETQQYAIVWDQHWLDELAAAKPGAARVKPAAARAVAKKAAAARAQAEGVHELRFSLAEAREVRLVPVIDFGGRKS